MNAVWMWEPMVGDAAVVSASFPLPHAFVPDPDAGPQDAGCVPLCRVCGEPYLAAVHVR